jgi:hypothetical protein
VKRLNSLKLRISLLFFGADLFIIFVIDADLLVPWLDVKVSRIRGDIVDNRWENPSPVRAYSGWGRQSVVGGPARLCVVLSLR